MMKKAAPAVILIAILVLAACTAGAVSPGSPQAAPATGPATASPTLSPLPKGTPSDVSPGEPGTKVPPQPTIGIPRPVTPTPTVPKGTPEEELVWVARTFSGGRQCAAERYVPPDTKELLEKAGIEVFDTKVEPLMVCQACDVCPQYAAVHYALIRADDVAKARELGFEPHEPSEE